MTRIVCAAIAACMYLLSSCVSVQVRPLPAFDASEKIAPAGETRSVWTSGTNFEELPTMVPFAIMTANGSTEGIASVTLANRATEMKADLLCMSSGGSVYSGSVSSATVVNGVATGFSAPTYTQVLYGCCYRLSPVRIGLRWDETGMITLVDEACQSSKIIEGDKIVSIAGSTVSTGESALRSPHLSKYLTLKPGQEVKIVWIRPGTGRMEGMVKLLPNPPTHLSLADPVKEDAARARANRQRD